MADKNSGKNGKHSNGAVGVVEEPKNGEAKPNGSIPNPIRLGKDCDYEKELRRLQVELVKLQEWVRHEGLRVVGDLRRARCCRQGRRHQAHHRTLNPRICRVVALGTPTEREKTQWYFQRYVAHLPAAGEMVLFDRSWYNRAGVERVMGFCTEAEYLEFMQQLPRVRAHAGALGHPA